ncbi:hypothetical protein ACFWZ2_27170 [Streptomyces sp. NPDC059002]|uniref:hypothetical protein n=1 Tax=Streptomyces sp. NPDC059002 TaxID=3346690 RepID=UPI003677619C
MNPINLVVLARLFAETVSADPGAGPRALDGVPPAERGRIEQVLAGLLASPEEERMLRLPLADTDMVDFEVEEEVGRR